MANEAWKIGVAIALEGGITGQLAEVISEFERMETIIDKIASALGKLGGRFDSASTGAKGLETAGTDIAKTWNEASKSIESAAKFAREAGNVKIPNFTPPRVPNVSGNGGAHGGSGSHFGMASVEGSMALQGPSENLQHIGREAIQAGMKYETAHELFVGRKDYNPKMDKDFDENTARLSKENPRVPLSAIREIVLTAIRNTGSPEHAYEAAGRAIEYQDMMQTISMQMQGLSAAEAVEYSLPKTEASVKAAELDGAVAKVIMDPKTGKAKRNANGDIESEFNVEKYNKLFDMIESVLKGSGGKVTGEDLKNMLITGGIAVNSNTMEGLLNRLTEAQTQNSHKIGTQAQALFQQFTTGIQTKRNFDEMQNLGVFDKDVSWAKGKGVFLAHKKDKADTVEKHTAGYGTDNAINADFTGWVQKVMIPALEKKGINDPQDQAKYIAQYMQASTARREIVENIIMGALINKDRQYNFDPQIVGKEGADKLASGMNGTQLELNAAWENSLTALGTSIIPALTPLIKDLTAELVKFSAWANENQPTVKRLAELGLVIIALDKACGALVAGGMLLGGLKNLGLGIKALAGGFEAFAIGSEAAGAIALLASPVGGVIAISVGILALSAAIVELGTHLDVVKDALKGVFEHVKDFASKAKDALLGPAPPPISLPPSAQQLPSALSQKPFMLAPGGLMNMGPIGAGNFKKSAYEMPLPNSGGALTRQAAYISPPANVTVNPIVQIAHNPDADRPQVVHVYLDGKDITNNVTMRMAKDLDGPRRGPTTYDSRMSASYPGTTSA